MIRKLKETIAKLLIEKERLINLTPNPQDLDSLNQYMYQLELKEEIRALHAMLEKPDSFEEEFKKRCVWRSTDTQQTISFTEAPQSLSNQLYWQIAEHVFKPDTMQKMLAIVLPNVTKNLTVFYDLDKLPPNLKPKELNAHIDSLAAEVVVIDNLERCEKAPDFKTFSSYIVVNNMLFNPADIELFSLNQHDMTQRRLQQDHPALVQKLSSRNASFRQLFADIDTLRSEGQTPRKVIERLKNRLLFGGTRVTDQEYVTSNVTKQAYYEFFNYFNNLPNLLRQKLRDMKGGGLTLGQIIDLQLERGECVETTADCLKKILERSENKNILDTPPKMTAEEVQHLNNKYKKNALDLSKDHSFNVIFNAEFFTKAITRFKPANNDQLTDVIINLPIDAYAIFLQGINFDYPDTLLKNISTIMAHHVFTKKQKLGLTQAILNCKKYQLVDLLYWAVEGKDPLVINQVLGHYPKNQRLERIKKSSKGGIATLEEAIKTPVLFKAMLELLTPEDRLQAFRLTNKHGQTVLHCVATEPDMLNELLEMVPKSERLALINFRDKKQNTVLHCAAPVPESLEFLLPLYPDAQVKVNAVLETNESMNTVVHLAAANLKSLQLLIGLFNGNEEKLVAAKLINHSGETVIHLATANLEALQWLFELFPTIEEKIKAIRLLDALGNTLLHSAAKQSASSLEWLLSLFPLLHEQREAVTWTNQSKDMVLHLATPAGISILLHFFQAEERSELIQRKLNNNESVLSIATKLCYPLPMILQMLPENEQHETLRQVLAEMLATKTIEEYLAYLKGLLKILPVDLRCTAIQVTKADGIPVYCLTAAPKFHMAVLAALPEHKRLNVLHSHVTKQSILVNLASKRVVMTSAQSKTTFKDSFVPEYLQIIQALTKSRTLEGDTFAIQLWLIQAENLVKRFMIQYSFAGVKKQLIDYIAQNPDNQISIELLKTLGIKSGLAELKQRWGFNEIPSERERQTLIVTQYLTEKILNSSSKSKELGYFKLVLEQIQTQTEMSLPELQNHVIGIRELVHKKGNKVTPQFFRWFKSSKTDVESQFEQLFLSYQHAAPSISIESARP